MLLLQDSNQVDIQIPLDHFIVYVCWLKCGRSRTTTFCKYGAIDKYPNGSQKAIADLILEIYMKEAKLVMSTTHVTLTVRKH